MVHGFAYYEQQDLWNRELLDIPAEKERIDETVRLVPPGVRDVLDVGCGNGAFLKALPDTYRKTGLDISREALKHVPYRIVLGSAESLPFEAQSFDLVTCLEVLEHLPRQTFEAALRELTRVSRRYVIISVPNSEVLLQSFVVCPECGCMFHCSRHLRAFDPATMVHLLEPHYHLKKLKEVGPMDAWYPAWLLRLWLVLRPPAFPRFALCPQCGYGGGVTNQRRFSRAVAFGKDVVKLLARPARARRWLVALYERPEPDR